jgi:hypothetical protein
LVFKLGGSEIAQRRMNVLVHIHLIEKVSHMLDGLSIILVVG